MSKGREFGKLLRLTAVLIIPLREAQQTQSASVGFKLVLCQEIWDTTFWGQVNDSFTPSPLGYFYYAFAGSEPLSFYSYELFE